MRIVFFGLPLAAWLLARDGHEIDLAVLAPVAAQGQRRLARRIGASKLLDARAVGDDLDARIEARWPAQQVDLLVSWYWTRKLPGSWLARPRLGAIGVHPSLLPRHRGPNPFFWTIDAGDVETGVSVHRLTERYDDGPVLRQVAIPLGPLNAWQLARALDRPGLRALRDVVSELARGTAPSERPQDESLACWAPEPTADELRVDFRWPTARVLRRVRALSPVPGVALDLAGTELFVTAAEPAPALPGGLLPGEAAALGDPPRQLAIRTGDGGIVLRRAFAGEGCEVPEGEPVDLERLAVLVASRTRPVLDWPALGGNE